jgi:regulator of replication initiation timing
MIRDQLFLCERENTDLRIEVAELRAALKEIEWSNNSKWQADRARAALEAKP